MGFPFLLVFVEEFQHWLDVRILGTQAAELRDEIAHALDHASLADHGARGGEGVPDTESVVELA